MATISKLTNDQVESVLTEFHLEVSEINPLGLDAPEFTRRVMTSALGEGKASTILSQVLDKPPEQRWCRGASVDGPSGDRGGFAREHPQISATVMTQLYDEQAKKGTGSSARGVAKRHYSPYRAHGRT